MKNLLVQMSRNSKLMIPVVGIIAMSLFIGGYIIRDGQITSRKEAEQQAQTANQAADNLSEIQTAEKQEVTEQKDSSSDDASSEQEAEENKQAPDVAKVSMTVSASANASNVVIIGTMTTDKPGTCTATLLQKGVKIASESNQAANGECTITMPRPSVTGEVKIQLTYAANDLSAKGIEDKDIVL